MATLQELKETLRISRGRSARYYIQIEFEGELYGVGFDDAHFWDALNDLDDKSWYDDAELTAVERIVSLHGLCVED